MFNKKVKVRFVKAFSCVDFGNVYEGMVRVSDQRTVNKYLDQGLCEIYKEPVKVEEAKESKVNATDKPKPSKKPSKS